mgnify:CR=1 FL=1
MAYNPNKELKLYYSIGEVAKMFNVNESLLRFWEKEISIHYSQKSRGGMCVSIVKRILRIFV